MNTADYRIILITRLLEQSARVDWLTAGIKNNLYPDTDTGRLLTAIRIRLQRTTAKLQALLPSSVNAWENIGDGG